MTRRQVEDALGSGVRVEGGVLAYPAVGRDQATYYFWFRRPRVGETRLAFVTEEPGNGQLKDLNGRVVWPQGYEELTIVEAFERQRD